MGHIERSRDNFQEWPFPPSTTWLTGIELRSPSSAVSVSTHWAISLSPVSCYFYPLRGLGWYVRHNLYRSVTCTKQLRPNPVLATNSVAGAALLEHGHYLPWICHGLYKLISLIGTMNYIPLYPTARQNEPLYKKKLIMVDLIIICTLKTLRQIVGFRKRVLLSRPVATWTPGWPLPE